ncbi:MAG: peptidoglycan -binding protein [Alphaproteobacteria bacterium]|jgi:chemotaxis protein MotB|nr:peptidoglycan -binding protein [Alphaproteobacteria bacterium]
MARPRIPYDTNRAWPGYVDVLSTLLMVIVFVLVVFVLAQFFLANALSGRDRALEQLNRQISELTSLLSLEQQANVELRQNVAQLSASLRDSTAARDQLAARLGELNRANEDTTARVGAERSNVVTLQSQLTEAENRLKTAQAQRDDLDTKLRSAQAQLAESDARLRAATAQNAEAAAKLREAEGRQTFTQAELDATKGRLTSANTMLEDEKKLTEMARSQVDLLNRQLLALREQMASLQKALDASEAKDKEQEAQISDLGRRLNVALARKVEELSKYRSEFFGRLREVLGNRRDVQIVGDRFVFQSEVLFPSGSAELNDAGREQMAKLAKTLMEISAEMPQDLPWILRVDGHTDRIPIKTAQFPSNWELSTARAATVAKFLIGQGVPPNRIAAAGFGEFQPLDDRDDEIALRRNRRIELKLTER